jgi:predicted enzyme related to lactoylglutathione lyase
LTIDDAAAILEVGRGREGYGPEVLEMGRVVHFEIPVDDAERAARFYSDAFGWQANKWEGPVEYWLVTTGPSDEAGIDGALTLRGGLATTWTNTVDVASVDETLDKVQAAGGKVLAPKMAVPGVGWAAYCQDTEGNTFGLMQADPTAQ